ncbi:hypothetical protein GCM10027598_26120 [Amycolatopsis oliviviridis]|uniref:AbiEi antitoxin C-terminal domain-containing protein n=1 Tax=Amycolatopsis oliviviridis TaxID=1471590 RepID=A0ABQ3LII2_9PSEU|nr:hypothetical protein [Amycolatopsis oliviviridis]GHH17157.1 hypothetical protein GCM10017790_33770 [Amycolatopsis oliviviridis]
MYLSRAPLTDSHLRQHSRHGVIRVATLEKLGVTQSTSYRRCQPGGRWTHLLPGIVLLSKEQPTARQRIEAALLLIDDLGVVTGFEAARRYGLRQAGPHGTVHVLIPEQRKVRSVKFAIIERTIVMPERRVIEGVPLAAPARAVLDGVRRIRDLDPVRSLLIETVEAGLCSVGELSAELESGSRRGTALPRAVLRELAAEVKSVPEAEALAIWKRAQLPPAEQNVTILDAFGNYVGKPDSWCDELALAWEIDSYAFHFGREAYRKTLHRNNRYAAAGIVVVQTLPSRIREEPEKVIAELRAAATAAASRPRPAVSVVRSDEAA